jgi:hypothetical protein
VEVEDCVEEFSNRPTSNIAWQRVVAVPQMVLPFGVDALLAPPGRTGLAVEWLTIHDFSFPGMVGFVFFGLAVVGLWKAWSRHHELLFWVCGGQVALIVLFWGLPAVPAWVAGLGLLPFIFIFGALGLTAVSPRAARWLALAVVLEWLLYLRALYYPIDGVPAGQYVVGWLLIAGGILAMLAIGHRALARGWPADRVEAPGPAERPEASTA